MIAERLTAVNDAAADGSGSLNHYCCCVHQDRSLCNADISGDEHDENCEVDCVVCVDLELTDECPHWGKCRK